ncbi:hypothetical protein Taro_039707 [Colocasia esculenta]|uniref:Uncharacterized protein n=1 Tax=Colocasia esculenta TaxID=4460 RepID=A0A843WGI9_COLES|nr:hypothetical protein [Colocasia esculenta]
MVVDAAGSEFNIHDDQTNEKVTNNTAQRFYQLLRVSDRLSVFKCPGRAFRYSSTRALEDRELVAMEIYIFMNCAELDPYIEEFDLVILQRNPRLIDVQVEKEREKSFATWLRSRRYGTWRTEWEGFHLRRPRVYADRDRLPVHTGRPGDRDRLLVHADRPDDRDRLPDPASSVSFPIPIPTRYGEDRSRFCFPLYYDLVHAYILGPMESWKEFPPSVRELLFKMFTRRYVFTRPEDLPRARVVWESTA